MEPVDPDLPHGVLVELHPLARQPGEPVALYRMKRALKMLLRTYGFRAEWYQPLRAKDGREEKDHRRKAS